MKRAIGGVGVIMMMASLTAAQSVENIALPQPAYHEYVRFMKEKKEIRSGKATVFTYNQWVQYCRGEFTGSVVKVGGRSDRTCRNFVNPGSFVIATEQPAQVAAQSTKPAIGNSMDANQQAAWFNEIQRQRLCKSDPTCIDPAADEARRFNERQAERAKIDQRPSTWHFMDAQEQAEQSNTHLSRCTDAGCVSVSNPNYKPAAPSLFYVPSASTPAAQCGRACGQAWTTEDFAAADAEIARLEQEIARLRQRAAHPIYVRPPSYTPYRYNPSAPPYKAPGYDRRSGSTYDWQSGNSYSWYSSSSGATHVNGMNLNTGSMWSTDIKRDGSMTGFDKNFNYWSYDAGSKTYMNLGTGEMCTGEGYARVCTGGRSGR